MSVPNPLLVPPQRTAIAGTSLCTNEWYVFFSRAVAYMQATGVDPSIIADMEARLAALEAAGAADFLLQGLLSVEVAGTPAGGLVQVSLVADEASPASTHYYGTSPSGSKGYHPIADAVAADAGELTKAVDPDGVTSFGLADVVDVGGGTLQKTAFDSKGRKTGTSAATTDDLAEGSINRYFTNARALGAWTGTGTSANFARGDGVYSNVLTGPLNWTIDSPVQMFGIASRYGNDAVPPQLSFQKARGTSSIPAAVQSGDQLLEFQARGYHSGGAFSGNVGGFRMVAIDNFTSTTQGTRFILRAANTGSTTVATVFESDSNRSWQPGSDNQQDIGAASTRMRTIYAGTGAINTSDGREKDDVVALTLAEISAAVQLSREVGTYRWLSSIEEKGEDARRHVGITVQRAIEIMRSHGLDPFRYAFICYDHWGARPEIWQEWPDEFDDEGNPVRAAGRELVQEAREAGDRYSFRHDQLLLFIARGQAARMDALEAALRGS